MLKVLGVHTLKLEKPGWNSLDQEMLDAPNVNAFKRRTTLWFKKNVTPFTTAIIPLILNAHGQYFAEILPEEFAICCCAQLLII